MKSDYSNSLSDTDRCCMLPLPYIDVACSRCVFFFFFIIAWSDKWIFIRIDHREYTKIEKKKKKYNKIAQSFQIKDLNDPNPHHVCIGIAMHSNELYFFKKKKEEKTTTTETIFHCIIIVVSVHLIFFILHRFVCLRMFIFIVNEKGRTLHSTEF